MSWSQRRSRRRRRGVSRGRLAARWRRAWPRPRARRCRGRSSPPTRPACRSTSTSTPPRRTSTSTAARASTRPSTPRACPPDLHLPGHRPLGQDPAVHRRPGVSPVHRRRLRRVPERRGQRACAHVTGIDGEDGGITVQLFPYDDTPNNGGEYKVWVTPTPARSAPPRATSTASCRATARPTTSRSQGHAHHRDRHEVLQGGASTPSTASPRPGSTR